MLTDRAQDDDLHVLRHWLAAESPVAVGEIASTVSFRISTGRGRNSSSPSS